MSKFSIWPKTLEISPAASFQTPLLQMDRARPLLASSNLTYWVKMVFWTQPMGLPAQNLRLPTVVYLLPFSRVSLVHTFYHIKFLFLKIGFALVIFDSVFREDLSFLDLSDAAVMTLSCTIFFNKSYQAMRSNPVRIETGCS